jgi:hypothetical protein
VYIPALKSSREDKRAPKRSTGSVHAGLTGDRGLRAVSEVSSAEFLASASVSSSEIRVFSETSDSIYLKFGKVLTDDAQSTYTDKHIILYSALVDQASDLPIRLLTERLHWLVAG